MSCACLNKNYGSELERFRRLAKSFAKMEDATVVIYKNDDGTYDFTRADIKIDKPIVEYITPY